MLREVDLFGSDMRSISPRLSAMSHINCQYIVDKDLEKGRYLAGFPGSEKFCNLGPDSPRGFYSASNNTGAYVVIGKKVIRIKRDRSFTEIGSIETEAGFISFADSGTQLMLVDGLAGYIINLPAFEERDIIVQTLTKITDVDFPKRPTSVIFNTGRFLVNDYGTGRFYGSEIFDGFDWDGLNFATAEAFPDNIIALVNGDFGVFYLMGSETIEIWYNDGSANFPYARMSGGVIQVGIITEGSVAIIGDSIIFLGISPSLGQDFFQLKGQTIKNITNAEMENELSGVTFPQYNIGAGYSANGFPVYQVSFLGGLSYFYDLSTGLWGKRRTRDKLGHIWKQGVFFLGQQLFTSWEDGQIYLLNNDLVKDGDHFQDFQFTGRHVENNQERFSVSQLLFNVEVGMGDDPEISEAPKATLVVSKDSGFTYSPEIFGSLGSIGQYFTRLIFRRLGSARDFVFRLQISDNVKRKVINCFIDTR